MLAALRSFISYYLELTLNVEDRSLRCLSKLSAIAAREPAAKNDTDSGSTFTCSQKDCRMSSRTEVLPAPGPPVNTILRRLCRYCSRRSA